MMQMPVVQAASPGTAAGEIALYTKTVSGKPDLFFQPQSVAAAGADVQMTVSRVLPASINPTLSIGGTASAGMVTFLPGGFVMMAGKVVTTEKAQTVTFAFTVTEINSVQITQSGNSPNVASTFRVLSTGLSNARFTYDCINGSAIGSDFYYTVIAKA